MEDLGFYLLLFLVLHPIIKLYKKYDCIKFKRDVILFTEEVLGRCNFSHIKFDTCDIKERVIYWLDTHNLNYYNREGKYYVENCASTILKEILVNEVDDDGDLVPSRIDDAVSWAMYYHSLNLTKKDKTTWFKTIWNSVNNSTLEDWVIAIYYMLLIIAWAITVNVYYTKHYSRIIYNKYNNEIEDYCKDVSSIRHSTMLMDTIFINVLDSNSDYYMNQYMLERAKELNKIIIENTESHARFVEFIDKTNLNCN